MSNEEFSFLRDFNKIELSETLQVNAIRTAFAGPVWAVFMLLNGEGFGGAIVYLLFFPVIYGVGGIPLGLLLSWLSGKGVPFTGIFSAIVAFMAAVGDPFTKLLHSNRPDLVPVENYKWFELVPIIFVIKPVDEDLRLQSELDGTNSPAEAILEVSTSTGTANPHLDPELANERLKSAEEWLSKAPDGGQYLGAITAVINAAIDANDCSKVALYSIRLHASFEDLIKKSDGMNNLLEEISEDGLSQAVISMASDSLIKGLYYCFTQDSHPPYLGLAKGYVKLSMYFAENRFQNKLQNIFMLQKDIDSAIDSLPSKPEILDLWAIF